MYIHIYMFISYQNISKCCNFRLAVKYLKNKLFLNKVANVAM